VHPFTYACFLLGVILDEFYQLAFGHIRIDRRRVPAERLDIKRPGQLDPFIDRQQNYGPKDEENRNFLPPAKQQSPEEEKEQEQQAAQVHIYQALDMIREKKPQRWSAKPGG